MTLDQLKAEVEKAGYTVSASSYENENGAWAYSKEIWGPGSYGSPKFCACFNKKTGWAAIGGRAVKVEAVK